MKNFQNIHCSDSPPMTHRPMGSARRLRALSAQLAAPVAAAEPGTGDWVMSMPLKEPGLQLETAPSIM